MSYHYLELAKWSSPITPPGYHPNQRTKARRGISAGLIKTKLEMDLIKAYPRELNHVWDFLATRGNFLELKMKSEIETFFVEQGG